MTVAVSTSITSDISALVGVVRTPSVLICRVKRVSSLQRGWKSLSTDITHSCVLVAWATLCGNAFMLHVNSRGGNENVIFGRHTNVRANTLGVNFQLPPMNTRSDFMKKRGEKEKFPHKAIINFQIPNFTGLIKHHYLLPTKWIFVLYIYWWIIFVNKLTFLSYACK